MCSLEPLNRLNKFVQREQKRSERRDRRLVVTPGAAPLCSPRGDVRLVVGRRFRPGSVLAVHLFDASRQSWQTHQVRVNYVIAGSARDWLLGGTLLSN